MHSHKVTHTECIATHLGMPLRILLLVDKSDEVQKDLDSSRTLHSCYNNGFILHPSFNGSAAVCMTEETELYKKVKKKGGTVKLLLPSISTAPHQHQRTVWLHLASLW